MTCPLLFLPSGPGQSHRHRLTWFWYECLTVCGLTQRCGYLLTFDDLLNLTIASCNFRIFTNKRPTEGECQSFLPLKLPIIFIRVTFTRVWWGPRGVFFIRHEPVP